MTRPAAAQCGVARVTGESLLVLLGVLAYLWLFRTYGFDVVDEGTQLAQIDRVARGARPYLDFETGYTPWYFLLQTSLWRLSAAELLATRTFGVVLHAATIALLFAVVRRWFGPLLAVCVAAFDLAFLLPVSPRLGAPFNTPYPGWLTAPLALAAQVAIAAVVHARLTTAPVYAARGAHAWPVLAAGLAAGVAFSVKPNAGLFVLAGALLALVASWPGADRTARTLAWLVRGAALLATVVLLGGASLEPTYAVALLLPVLLAALRSAPLGERPDVRPLRDGALLATGFVAPVVIWAVPLLRELGVARFAREVLLLDGGSVIGAYLLPLPFPETAALALCAAGVLAALLARRARARDPAAERDVARWLAPGTLGLGFGLAAVLGGDAPVRVTAEEVCLWLGPVALVVGLALLPRAPATARVHGLLVFATIYSLQLFPRPDLIHVAMGAPPLLAAVAGMWWWLTAPLDGQRVRRLDRPLSWVVAGLVLVLCVARAAPALRVRLGEPLVALEAGPRAPLVIAASHVGEQRWLGEAVREITSRTGVGEAVFYFPDLAGLGFLAARPSPSFYVYFVPGRPDRAGEERTIAELERVAPRLAVTGAPRVAAFAGASGFFSALDAYLRQHYRVATELGACTIRERVGGR